MLYVESSGWWTSWLYVKFEFDDVAVLHDVRLTFGAEFAGGFDGLLGAECLEVVVVHDAGGNEATFEVGMDGTGSLWGGGTFFDGPGATFFFAGGEERLKTENVVGGLDEFFEGVVLDAVAF